METIVLRIIKLVKIKIQQLCKSTYTVPLSWKYHFTSKRRRLKTWILLVMYGA